MVATNAAAHSGTTDGAPRRRGRPRLVEVDDRILETALDEICESGTANLTFDRLSLRSGVAKTTIYRRWSTKNDLIIDAIDLLRSQSPVPNSGDLRADLEAGLDNMLRVFTSRRGRAIAAVFAECQFNDELAAAWHETIAAPHQAAFRAVLERGVASGEVRLVLDIDQTVAVMGGIVFLVLLDKLPMHAGLAAGVVATVLDGIGRPAPTTPSEGEDR